MELYTILHVLASLCNLPCAQSTCDALAHPYLANGFPALGTGVIWQFGSPLALYVESAIPVNRLIFVGGISRG